MDDRERRRAGVIETGRYRSAPERGGSPLARAPRPGLTWEWRCEATDSGQDEGRSDRRQERAGASQRHIRNGHSRSPEPPFHHRHDANWIAEDATVGSTREAAEQVTLAAARMERLLRDLLDFARFESGTLRIVKRTHDVGVLVTEAFHAYRPLFEERRMTLTAEPPPKFSEPPRRRATSAWVDDPYGGGWRWRPGHACGSSATTQDLRVTAGRRQRLRDTRTRLRADSVAPSKTVAKWLPSPPARTLQGGSVSGHARLGGSR